ncbi:MAG: T9SS type A sorting domain-containing protein [Bacteroidales bacterium]|nr:T9SS type A sorting domain-containing protein [Bacteroidales bacterium]
MERKLLLVLLIVALVPLKMMAEWVPLGNNKTNETLPKVTLISDDGSSTVVKIELSGFNLKTLVTRDKTYQQVDLMGESYTTVPGSPEIPYIAKVLAIPDQAGVTIDILETGTLYTYNNIVLPPARPSWWEGDDEPPYLENSDAYRSDEAYPSEVASMDAASVFRDFRISRLAIYPLRYLPGKSELQVYSSITVRVNYDGGEVINPKTTSKKAISPSFAQLYRNFIFNYDEVLQRHYNGREDGREVMLCIMPDIFTASFQIYADWKRESGTDVHVTKFSDIGANGNNPDIVKNHIADAYSTWENPPTYVLIVGDNGVFPKKTVSYPGYTFAWEEYFVTVDGNDYFPEMMIGRFTNQEDYRMQVMINKFMLYEKQPYTQDPSWFRKGTCCSNNEYESQVETKRFAAAQMLDYGFTSVDTMMSDGYWSYNCTYNINDIKSAINEGRSYLNYRGEGWYYGWYANCYDFHTDDVSSLSNGQKFTFVTSIGCGVAMFDASGGNCFGEEWVQLGSLTSPRGGVAFVGPTSNTHTTYNNRIDKGIYVGMFQEGMDTPGQALTRGKLYMYNVFGNEYYVEYHYKVFCVLGDPSIHIWKDVPQQVTVDYPAVIPVGNNFIEFQVNFAGTGFPVSNAQVTITGDEIFASRFTDGTGKVTIELMPLVEENLTVTVRGGRVIPFQGTMQVTQPDELIEPEGSPVVDDLDGNNDGLVNPNETCSITYTLKNWGSTMANSVQATLLTSDPMVQIITVSPVSFGNLAPGAQVTGSPFQFFVSEDCPIGHIVPLQLHVVSTNNTWDYIYNVEVKGCMLSYNNFVVFDGGTANNNYRLDPGETAVVVVSVSNIGEDTAPDVMGLLTSSDPYITIVDGIGSFGNMAINGNATNYINHFGVSVAANCPAGHMADFELKLSTQNGLYPYETTFDLIMPVALPIPQDYTGPDAYGYYAYSSDDTFYDQTPEYEWLELVDVGTQVGLPSLSDYTQTVNLPFTFRYYGIDYSQVRISTDGWIAFGSGTQTAPVNTALPNNDNVNNMVAVFWDDLYDDEFFMGKMYYHHDAANHRFIVEWDSISHNNFVTEPVREVFQVVLNDPNYYVTATGDGEIIMQYKFLHQPETATVGIENHTQNIGLTYVFDASYAQTATNLDNYYAVKFTTEPPFESMVVSVDDQELSDNLNSSLRQNLPNPFSDKTDISYTLSEAGLVNLEVYNIRGDLVRTLVKEIQTAGDFTVEWNGTNDAGYRVVPGVYFCRLQTENTIEAIKLLMLK